ncbi:MAG TPA: response regulator [Myxococcota bacterium]|nr:response regulator [Myxococcota bacterium]
MTVWLTITGIVALAGIVSSTILGLRLSASRRRGDSSESDPLQPVPDTQPEAGAGRESAELERIRNNLVAPFNAGGVISFLISLENDRLSNIMLTGRKMDALTEEMALGTALELVHPDDRDMVRAAIIESLSRQRSLEIVFRTEREKTERFVHARGIIRKGASKTSATLMGTLVEITELQRARRTMTSWMEILDAFVDLLPRGVAATDRQGVVTVWNAELERLSGIPSGSVIGCPKEEIESPEAVRLMNSPDDRVAMIPFGGREFSVRTLVASDRDDRNGCIFKVLEPAFQPSATDGFAEVVALGRLTGGIAHDFANLAQVILGYTEILKQEAVDAGPASQPAILEDIAQIEQAALHAKDMVQQLGSFCSRDIQAVMPCDPDRIIQDFLSLAKRVLGESIGLRFHPSQKPLCALADPAALKRAILKLLLKVRDSGADDEVVAISTREVFIEADWPVGETGLEPGAWVKVSVSCQTTGWAVSAIQGSLDDGLAFIMGAMGGCLNVHESPDLGTTVSLYFKTGEEFDEHPVRPGKPQATSPTRTAVSATILVVEDDAPVRKLTAKALRQAGHSVIEASDGVEAVDAFMKQPDAIDLLVTDVIMPGMNGREVCERINRVRPDLPVVFCSGYSSDLLQSEYMLNIHGLVIQKPFRSADLLATVARLLG